MGDSRSDESSGHDVQHKDGYEKRCYCEKCVGSYDEWCRKRKEEGCTTCKRKCYTICKIECEKPVTTTYKWGHHEKFEGRWEDYHGNVPLPKHCKGCKKDEKHCSCRDKKSRKRSD